MSILTVCPCCSSSMLRHIGNHREYWFCRHCWQEMPDLDKFGEKKYRQSNRIVNLSIGSKVLVTPR